MKPTPSSLALAALLALALPGEAAAHGVRAEVERRGDDVAVRATYESGRPLAGARFVVTSPARQGEARREGKTDRDGWVVFTPDAPGAWKVRVVDATGHGRTVTVEVAPSPPPAPAGAATPPAPPAEPDAAPASPAPVRREPVEGGADAVHVVGGVAIVALVFGALYAAGQRRRAAGR